MLPDETQLFARWLWLVRPDLARLEWQQHADELETLVALAAWRAQPFVRRVEALCDALDVDRPPRFRPAVEVSCGTWSEDVADPGEWGGCGEAP